MRKLVIKSRGSDIKKFVHILVVVVFLPFIEKSIRKIICIGIVNFSHVKAYFHKTFRFAAAA